jgi:hypothetical protein
MSDDEDHGALGLLGAATAVLGVSLLDAKAHADAPRLLVFLHSAVKQRAFQAELREPLPGLSVTSVGRVSDFERARKQGQDALLTHPVVLQTFGVTPRLRGFRAGKPDEAYSLVSVGALLDPLLAPSVGTLDILGRDGTVSFVRRLLGASPEVERVTKVEDLLALLQMKRVSAILLPTRLFPELAQASRLALVQRELATRVELPALAVVGPEGEKVLAAVTKVAARFANLIGVDQWLP